MNKRIAAALLTVLAALPLTACETEQMSKDDFDAVCAMRGGVPADDLCFKGSSVVLSR